MKIVFISEQTAHKLKDPELVIALTFHALAHYRDNKVNHVYAGSIVDPFHMEDERVEKWQKVLSKIEAVKPSILYVQCQLGQSRSWIVASAIAREFGQNTVFRGYFNNEGRFITDERGLEESLTADMCGREIRKAKTLT